MTAVASPRPLLARRADLNVERTDVEFRNVTPARVAVAVTVRNQGTRRSEETFALVSAAPLGAFVPWRPLAVLDVPALEPGETRVLRTEARRPAVKPLGPPDRVPPRQLLTALGEEDQEPERTPAQQRRRRLLGQLEPGFGVPDGELPADLHELFGRTNPHWTGNVNVFLGGRAVERHCARAMRIYPGRLNLADFIVGSRPDSYRFRLEGDGAGWGARLYDAGSMANFQSRPPREAAVAPGEWLRLPGMGILFLALCPPADARRGAVEVHVEQQSTGQAAVVEFDLDAGAEGPGCYVAG